VPLTDPELDLLLEMLEDDAAASVYEQVGEELVRRARWAEAAQVLRGGIAEAPTERALELLARAALEIAAYDEALECVSTLKPSPARSPELARIEILALERSGRIEQARDRASAFLDHDPRDVVVAAVIERLTAPPPTRAQRAADPFYTVERAERYVELGRTDRAVRVYRRILLANPRNPSLELRMRQLSLAPADVEDDLSRELTDPGLVPELPDTEGDRDPPAPIDMPNPRLQSPVSEDGPTDTPSQPRDRFPPTRTSVPPPPPPRSLGEVLRAEEQDDMPTQLMRAITDGLPSELGASGLEDEETVLNLPRRPTSRPPDPGGPKGPRR
jgi:tetratricopeptide (TPR) repeat protein